jgi:anaerobic ribonucleoside-triphosphate reductase activating protein
MNYLKVSAIIKTSTVNGPGIRYCIFTQGCIHKCPGCHSPHTWDISKGERTHILDIFTDIIKNKKFIDGVTLSGGDPLVQYEQVLTLCKLLKVYNINVWMWTGYKMSEIRDVFPEILNYVDTIIDDTYNKDKPTKKKYRGSDNQIKWDRIDGKWKKEESQ